MSLLSASNNVDAASSIASNNIKTITSAANQSVSLPQGTQIVTQAVSPGQGGGVYSILPQQLQNLQSVQIDGQEAFFIPASSFQGGQIQIGNQILSPNQTIVRSQNQPNNQQQQQVIQTVAGLQGNVQFAQIAGNQTIPVQVRQGNVVQTLQLPLQQQQQTIPVQIPISTSNGQTIYQTIQLPLSALQAVTGGNNIQQITTQVMPQMAQQVQVAPQQMQVTQQGNAATAQIKQEPGEQTTTSQHNSQSTNTAPVNTNHQGQTVLANVQLPNGQMGQLVAAGPQMWQNNTINLSQLSKFTIICDNALS